MEAKFDESFFLTADDDKLFRDNYFKFQQRMESIGYIRDAFDRYSYNFKALLVARDEVFNAIKNNWKPSFGKLEDFSIECNKSIINIGNFVKKFDAYIDEKLLWFKTIASDFEDKIQKRHILLAKIKEKKKDIKILRKKASAILKIEEIEEDIENLEESLESTEKDLWRYMLSPSAQEDFKRFIRDLIKHEKEYHKKDMEVFSSLKKIIEPEKLKMNMKNTFFPLTNTEGKDSPLRKVKSLEDILLASRKTPEAFYYSDIKAVKQNLLLDNPLTSSGIRVYHSDDMFSSTSFGKLLDDQMSKDINDFDGFFRKAVGEFDPFVTQEDEISPTYSPEESDDDHESHVYTLQEVEFCSKSSPKETDDYGENEAWGYQRTRFAKHAAVKIKYQYAFIHNSRFRFGEIKIKMPSLSPTMTEGTIVKWLKKEGDTVTPGDVLCEIQTDKAVVGLETEEEGVLTKILVPENTQNVQLGKVIALILGEGEDEIENETVENAIESSTPETPTRVEKKDHHICGPSVKKLLTEYGIKYSDVPSSGPKGNLLKGDVLKFINDKKLKQLPVKVESKTPKLLDVKLTDQLSHIDIPISSSQISIAKQLIYSKTAMPHAYMNVDCKVDKIFGFMKKMKQDGFEVSLNDFLIKSVATALRKVPKINIMIMNGQIKPLDSINISINIANNCKYLSATIKNADELTVQCISEQMNSLAAQTNDGKFAKEDVGSSFRISSLEMTGVSGFTSVLNPSEVAVLAVGTVKCVFDEQEPVRKIGATLSFNNELIDENEAGLFLNHLKQYLENPLSICLT
ncbi:pyruvate dehydrogenase protein X component, mitochondrial [Caerostris darwini]|uniref:Dihydrolipoamide acetyltransferase component of pyruvate dehydrogenase complex n=1 Tax=Caerostris darwini TaxID=1538125 RepID=A0AAV4PRR1_9ARAC|nr:pyruvate dehydrogenase protein X component, mitochondrial [Caerostris darwini]